MQADSGNSCCLQGSSFCDSSAMPTRTWSTHLRVLRGTAADSEVSVVLKKRMLQRIVKRVWSRGCNWSRGSCCGVGEHTSNIVFETSYLHLTLSDRKIISDDLIHKDNREKGRRGDEKRKKKKTSFQAGKWVKNPINSTEKSVVGSKKHPQWKYIVTGERRKNKENRSKAVLIKLTCT